MCELLALACLRSFGGGTSEDTPNATWVRSQKGDRKYSPQMHVVVFRPSNQAHVVSS